MMKFLRYLLVSAFLFTAGAGLAYGSDNDENIAPETQTASIRTFHHAIEITVADYGHDAVIYAVTGQVVKQLSLDEGTTRIDLNPGYYIVRIDGQSKRIVVK